MPGTAVRRQARLARRPSGGAVESARTSGPRRRRDIDALGEEELGIRGFPLPGSQKWFVVDAARVSRGTPAGRAPRSQSVLPVLRWFLSRSLYLRFRARRGVPGEARSSGEVELRGRPRGTPGRSPGPFRSVATRFDQIFTRGLESGVRSEAIPQRSRITAQGTRRANRAGEGKVAQSRHRTRRPPGDAVCKVVAPAARNARLVGQHSSPK